MKALKIIYLFIVYALFTSVCAGGDIEGTMTVDGLKREYILHLPKDYSADSLMPLVMVFHGGGGTASQVKNHTKFNRLSDKENFIVVYPNSVDKNWSDGRVGDKLPEQRDDAKFISMLIDTLTANYKTDPKRVFSTGISNGGFFSIYLAYRLSDKILAIAPVTANIPENMKDVYKTDFPVSIMLINGTKDPLVKYEGGAVGFGNGFGRGTSLSTDESINIWLKNNGCTVTPAVEEMANKDKDDGCTVTKYIYSPCSGNTEIILIKIDGGGHTWPGASQYLSKFIVGKVCNDFNATEVIWEFFKKQPVRQ